MRNKIYLFIFIVVFLLGFLLRFIDLGEIPDSLNWDEVSWGYNAYSILKTGHDEHGNYMPLSFKAFGDYKQPVYVYLSSASIGLFGLDAFAVRMPSALLGSLTIFFVWFLVLNLFYKEKNRYLLSLAAMFFFAVSPWSIQFSRVAYEANVGLFFVVSGVSVFLYGINKRNNIFAIIGIILMSVSCYTYHSNKLFTPLLLVGFLTFLKLSVRITKKQLIIFLILFAVLNSVWVLDSRTTARGRSVTFVSNQTPILEHSAKQLIMDKEKGDILGSILHNRRVVYSNYYFENYLKHFDLNFLFVMGDNARHHAFGMGVLFLASLPLIVIGIINLNLRKYWIVFFWLFTAPLASAIAVDAPNASRSLAFLPTWHIFEAIGLLAIFSIKSNFIRKIAIITLFLIFSINLIYYMHNYFKHTNSEYGIYWQHGYKETMFAARKYKAIEKKVIISKEFEQGYIFYLFHNQIDPFRYIKSAGSERIKDKCYSIENVYFGECEDEVIGGSVLITREHPDGQNYIKIEEILDDRGDIVGYVLRQV